MSIYWIIAIVGLVVLAATIPDIAYIRHPKKTMLSAYTIFVSVFLGTAVVLFTLFGWVVGELELTPIRDDPGPVLLFMLVVFVFSVSLGRWLAKKPPRRQAGPHT